MGPGPFEPKGDAVSLLDRVRHLEPYVRDPVWTLVGIVPTKPPVLLHHRNGRDTGLCGGPAHALGIRRRTDHWHARLDERLDRLRGLCLQQSFGGTIPTSRSCSTTATWAAGSLSAPLAAHTASIASLPTETMETCPTASRPIICGETHARR